MNERYIWRKIRRETIPPRLLRFMENPEKYSPTQRYYDSVQDEWALVSGRWGTYRYRLDLSEIYRLEPVEVAYYV